MRESRNDRISGEILSGVLIFRERNAVNGLKS